MLSRIQVGLDVSQKWFDIYTQLGKEVIIRRFVNNEGGIKQFIEEMRGFGAKKIHVCMEFTGGMELSVALACREAGFMVSIVDGARIAFYRKSFSSTGAGSDKKSAYLLARYCKERSPEQWFPVAEEYRKLRELVRHRQKLIRDKGEWSCRTSLNAEDELVQAQRVTLVRLLQLQIEEVDKRIAEHVRCHESLNMAAHLLQTIPGIAIKSACIILAEMGPIENYGSAKSLALAAGLVPITIHSGKHTPPGKLPVYGNRALRTALYFPTLVCKRNRVGVGPFVERIGSKDKSKMTAIVAGMRKLAHVIYGVLASQACFDQSFIPKQT